MSVQDVPSAERLAENEVEVCPHCDRGPIRKRKSSMDSTAKDDRAYICKNRFCGETFDEPKVRPRRGGHPWTARKMLERLGVDTSQLEAFDSGGPS